MQCPNCGAHASEKDLFCGECGRPLAGSAPPFESESPPDRDDQPADRLILVPPSSPAAPAIAPPKAKKSFLVPVLVLTGVFLLLFCLFAAGVLVWLGGSLQNASEEAEPITTPTSTQTSARGPLLFDDDFAGSGWEVYDDEDTSASYEDGEYRLTVHSENYMTWGNPTLEESLTDYEVEVDARQVEGPLDNNFGLLVRYQSRDEDDEYYWFQISGDGYYSVDLQHAGEWITLVSWTESDVIQQGLGVTNHLRVVCSGAQFDFYVNDTYLTSVEDSALLSGGIGLAAGAFDEPGVVVHFDNLKVYALQE